MVTMTHEFSVMLTVVGVPALPSVGGGLLAAAHVYGPE
jgi:hypothetical protein